MSEGRFIFSFPSPDDDPHEMLKIIAGDKMGSNPEAVRLVLNSKDSTALFITKIQDYPQILPRLHTILKKALSLTQTKDWEPTYYNLWMAVLYSILVLFVIDNEPKTVRSPFVLLSLPDFAKNLASTLTDTILVDCQALRMIGRKEGGYIIDCLINMTFIGIYELTTVRYYLQRGQIEDLRI